MTTSPARPAVETAAGREPGTVRLVLDVELALDDAVADLIRDELARDATIEVVLLLPGMTISTDAAVVALRRRRLAQARQRRVEELARIAGPRSAQVTIAVQRRRWRLPEPLRSLIAPGHRSTIQEGPDR